MSKEKPRFTRCAMQPSVKSCEMRPPTENGLVVFVSPYTARMKLR